MNLDNKDQTTYVCVVGTGSAGSKHLEALGRIKGVTPIAIPIRPDRLQKLTDMGHTTAATITDSIGIGATHCIIATDSGRHLSDCSEAIENGLHILCEKPLGVSSREALEIRSQAIQSGRILYVGYVLRFSKSLEIFREQLLKLGDLHSVRVECQSYLPDWRPTRPYQESYSQRACEGGVLLDLSHEIDYTGWLFGWPNSIFARVANLNRLDIKSNEIAEMSWQTATGCMVSICIDYLSRPPHRTIRASGANGSLSWNWHTGTVVLNLSNQDTKSWTSSQEVSDLFFKQALSFLQETQGITSTGGKSLIATASDGYKVVAVCDAANRSSQNKQEENIEYL